MGNNSSRGKEQVEISINHPKFQQTKLLHRNNKQTLKTSLSCDEKTYKSWKNLLSQYHQIDHEYLLLPRDHNYKSSGVCATRGQVEIEYNNYPYLLTQQIHNRKGKKTPFTQPQLWYLLYAYLSAKNYLAETAKYPHSLIGDIRPENVFLNQNGEVRFSNLFSWPGQKINYKKTFDGIITYLSPEDYEILQLGSMNNQKNQKSQFFSIGFTIVSAAILKDNSDCYDIQKQKFNSHQAKKRINAFKCSSIYSQLLRGIVSSFCGFEPKKRINFSDIWLWITKYQRRIITKQPFMIDEVPPKINQHINVLRADIANINPQSSVLTIKSLRGSQQRNELSALRSSEKVNQESQKRASRIVINSGVAQKVFYSPNNGYFKSQVSSPSQIQYFQSPPTYFQSPPPRNVDFVASKVHKSPEGFYSPKNAGNGSSQPFRVFIQYKSPTKPIQKPYAQTIYVGKDGQTQNVTKVENTQTIFKKKDSDAKSQKSQKSGDSNRQNRFIQETKRQIQKIQSGKDAEIPNKIEKQSQDQKKVEKSAMTAQVYKKLSPIHQIISTEQIVINHGVSEVVSQQIILPNDKASYKEDKKSVQKQIEQEITLIQQSSELPRQIKQDSIIRTNNRGDLFVDENRKSEPIQERFQVSFSVHDNVNSAPQSMQKTKQIGQVNSHEKQQVYTEAILQQRHEQYGKTIENWSESDKRRHQQEELINKQTFDDGRHVVPPKRDSSESISMKFEIPERHKDVKPYNTIQQLQASMKSMPSYVEMVAELTPVSRSIIKKDQPVQLLDQQLKEQINKKIIEALNSGQLGQLETSSNNLENLNEKNVNQHQQILTPIQQQHKITSQVIQNQIASEKEPEDLNNYQQPYPLQHQIIKVEHAIQQTGTIVQKETATEINDKNILIIEDNSVEIEDQNAEPNKFSQKSQEHPFIPLGPQTNHTHSIHQQVTQVYHQQEQNQDHSHQGEQIPVKKPQSPFQQIQEQSHEPLSQQIQFQQRKIVVADDSSKIEKNQVGEPLESVNESFPAEFHTNDEKSHNIQMPNSRQEVYKSVPYQHEVSLGGHSERQRIIYNVYQVGDRSLPLQNKQQSDIQGSGRFHSRFIQPNAEHIVILDGRRILDSEFQTVHQDFNIVPSSHNPITIQQVFSEKIIVQPKETVEQQILAIDTEDKVSLSNKGKIDLQDPFLRQVRQTNQKLAKLQEEQEEKRVKQDPFVLHHLQRADQHFISAQIVGLEAHPQQNNAIAHKSASQVHQSGNDGSSKIQGGLHESPSLQNQAIKNSQIQFDIVKEIIGKSKEINQKYQRQLQVKDNLESQRNENILPLSSNQNQAEQVYLQISNLHQTIQPVPTDSEFGNISQIMDINRQFHNTLNNKEINFLQLTTDPKSNQFLKELFAKSQRGQVQEDHLEKVAMSQQDRKKLSHFVQKFCSNQTGPKIDQAIEQFRSSISKGQAENKMDQLHNSTAQDNKLHMSAQDKQKLGIVLSNLEGEKGYHSMDHLQINEKQIPANYEQSNVDIKYSELKTELVIEKPETQVHSQEYAKEIHEKRRDIIDEVIEINRSIKPSKETDPIQVAIQNLQSSPTNPNQREQSENFSLEVNFNQNSIKQARQPNNDRQSAQSNNDHASRSIHGYSVKQEVNHQITQDIVSGTRSLAGMDIIDEVIQINEEIKQLKGSRVNASAGEKSERQDPVSQFKQQIGSEIQQATLHSLKYQRALSEPNVLQSQNQQNPENQHLTNGIVQVVSTIEQQIHEEHHEDNAVTKIQDQIVQSINQVVTAIRIDPQIAHEQAKVSTSRSSQRRSRPRDFLDQVMDVNKIINKEQSKDYYQNNKFLAQGPVIVLTENQDQEQKHE